MPDRGGHDYDHVGQKLRTLRDCALYRRTIKLTCSSCGRARLIDAIGLWWLFEQKRWPDGIPAAWRRLYCRTCYSRTTHKIVPRAEITRAMPEPDSYPRPSERQWKQIVSRYRS